MKTGVAVVELLQAYSVEQVFGIPGTHSIELYRGLSQSTVRHILPRHEQGAGFMADGYARYTGKPGVCFVITGPGVTNIATPMAQAYSDSIPMLVLSPVNDLSPGQMDASAASDGVTYPVNQGRLHELTNQAAVTRPFTAFSETATSAEHVAELIHAAFRIFESERPRPVHINIPLSILRAETSGGWQRAPFVSPQPVDSAVINEISANLAAAERPVIVAGGGCRHFAEVVITLAEKVPAAVITTVAGRGTIQGTHPLYAGAQPSVAATRELLEASDFVLAVGTEMAETDFWDMPPPLPARQVWINLDPDVPYETVSDSSESMTVVTDAQPLMLQISASLQDPAADAIRAAQERVKSFRQRHGEAFSPVQSKHWRVLTELRKHLAHDVVVTSDMTQLAYTACDNLALQTPNSWFHPVGYGTLGYALPAAVGIKCARNEVPVLAIVGDAGFQYTVAELAVAAEHNLNIVILLWNNDALQQIADDMTEAEFALLAVHQQNPDFDLLTRSLGAEYQLVNGLSALGPALEQAFTVNGPTVLELHQSRV